ncbi:MAG TPA: MMPL family transporter [Gaiellaceae bacterium]|nr:MMPL family transporter [Gaiellaceae bacterium]
MERFAHTMIRFRWFVLAAWLVILVASAITSSGLNDLLTNRFVLPGAKSEKAGDILKDNFGQRPEGSFSLVVKGKPGSAQSLVGPTRAAAERAARALDTGKVQDVRTVAGDVVSATIVSQLQPADAKGYTGAMREAAGEIPGATLYVSGQSAIEHDLEPVQNRDLFVGEVLIAVPIALVILVFVFGTLAFLLPFMLATVAIPTTLAFVWIFANFMTLSTYLTNMVTLIGLGIAIDYSLLMVHRYREERRAGQSKEEAVAVTMNTAGRAVVFSGTAVAIGLALMLFMPLPFMRGFGLAGLLIPLVSVAAALTLLPVLIFWLEDRMDQVRLIPRRIIERREDAESGFWARLATTIMRRPATFATATTAGLVLLAVPVLSLQLGPGSNEGIPQNLEAVEGLNTLSDAVGAGALSPTDIVIDTKREGGAADPQVRAGVERLASLLRGDSEVADVVAGGPQTVDASGRYLHIQAIGKHEYGLPESQEFVDRLRDVIVPAAAFPGSVDVLAGGGPPFGVDFLDITYGAFPWLVLAVLLLTYILLVRAFRSLVLPLKAIVLNLLSIGAAYGILVLAFKFGAGEPFGLTQFDQIEGWIPVFLFAMLFGLSMDYEVFLVTRMREEWDKTKDNEAAVRQGLAKTGRLVTAAGLIMVAAFMGFVAGSIVGLQQFGLGLAAAILIDVTIIRALLVPSAMKLFGRWNWWLPQTAAKLFRVKPSPLEAGPAPALRPAGK